MGLVATYELRCEHLPLVDVAAAVPDATLEVSLVASADGPIPLVVRLVDGPASDIEIALAEDSFVESFSVLDDGSGAVDGSTGEPAGTDGGPRRYKVRPAVGLDEYWADELDDVSELRALAETDSEIDVSRVQPWGWLQRGWFADRETLAQFRDFWMAAGGFRLQRLTPDAGDAPGDGGLTDRQREALVTAHDLGYFDIPRTASLDAVADELGIGASALSERLRRAQAHLVETTVAPPPRRD
jgi:hypothetical protein